MNDTNMKADANANATNGSAEADKKPGFEMSFFQMPRMAMPGVFREIAENGVVRLKENCEKMKAASGEMADVVRETYSTNTKGAADYGAKVIEISSVNTTFAFDFFTNLMGKTSLSEVMTLSTAQARRNFEVASAQNKELWDLAQKVAIETAEPIKKSVATAQRRLNHTYNRGSPDRLEVQSNRPGRSAARCSSRALTASIGRTNHDWFRQGSLGLRADG